MLIFPWDDWQMKLHNFNYIRLLTCEISHVTIHIWNFTCEVSYVKFHMWNFTCEKSHVKFHVWNTCEKSHVKFHMWNTSTMHMCFTCEKSHVFLELHMWFTCAISVREWLRVTNNVWIRSCQIGWMRRRSWRRYDSHLCELFAIKNGLDKKQVIIILLSTQIYINQIFQIRL